MTKKRGGIGAKGLARACFFHPGQNIRNKLPNQHQTMQLSGVLLMGKGSIMSTGRTSFATSVESQK